MENLTVDAQYLEKFQAMGIESNRLKTFTSKWPHSKRSGCKPENMAKAGFYHVPADCPDSVCCFACHKELDNWEPTDDPLDEHQKHSKDCPYLKLIARKKLEDITVEDMIDLDKERYMILVKKHHTAKINDFMKVAEEAAVVLEKMLS